MERIPAAEPLSFQAFVTLAGHEVAHGLENLDKNHQYDQRGQHDGMDIPLLAFSLCIRNSLDCSSTKKS